jgi:gamma-glutamyl hercynylcysteine S-oxide synthase
VLNCIVQYFGGRDNLYTPAENDELMLSETYDQKLRNDLTLYLRGARCATDELFHLVLPQGMTERPVPERHRIIFYLGHLEAFDWNLIAGLGFGIKPFHESFNKLFAFGIDPVDRGLPSDRATDWPSIDEVHRYNRRVRETVDDLVQSAPLSSDANELFTDGLIIRAAIEHRLMHAETLAYMLHWLPYELKKSVPAILPQPQPPARRQVDVSGGAVTLGLKRDFDGPFGWDNEFEAHMVEVPAFSMDAHNVTNADYLKFIEAGGYLEKSFWTAKDWQWIASAGVTHPKFWLQRDNTWFSRTMFADVPLQLDWPVYVSHAEASAYARWTGQSLPTEAQYHRAAFGCASGAERLYPWGNEAPSARHGNFDFAHWNPAPIGSFPEGTSAFGVADLMGNGWEWTSTIFDAFAGFKPFSFYPGYSADFFDGSHYVLKGASARTSRLLLRRSFRNWFQPRYPNIYATFRCVTN